MHLYLLRHTQVDVPQGICYGQTDVGLAKSFTEELDKIIGQLKGIEFDHFYTSPLKRCILLAEQIEQKLATQPFIKDDRLKELNFGDWETQLWTDIEDTAYAKKWFSDWVNMSTPNGESYLQLMERVKLFLTDLKNLNKNTNILIVSHGGVIRAINAIINKLEPINAFELKVEYGQLLKLTV